MKLENVGLCRHVVVSLPTRERGLKFHQHYIYEELSQSRPTRERGLKSISVLASTYSATSLPTRERGLKSIHALGCAVNDSVAPYAGAWIEISDTHKSHPPLLGRSLRGSVD